MGHERDGLLSVSGRLARGFQREILLDSLYHKITTSPTVVICSSGPGFLVSREGEGRLRLKFSATGLLPWSRFHCDLKP